MSESLSIFVGMRSRLFAIAYRIVGNSAAAEDVVQDTWLRWQAIDHSVVQNGPAYLATTTARLAINVVHSARARRERYVGEWLPEPVDTRPDSHSEVERGEALEHAVLRLLETLTPRETVAYVLREAFSYSYRQIADIVQLAEANARQIVTRARKRVAGESRPTARSGERRRLLGAFIAAARKGDPSGLEELCASGLTTGLRL
jgi:RNA polymerase sigma-70 factor (ECF subfamily)